MGVRMGRAWQKTCRWSRQGLPADLLFRVAPPVDALDARTAGPVTPQGRTAGEPGSSADGWVVRTGEGPASGGKGGRQKKKRARKSARRRRMRAPPLFIFLPPDAPHSGTGSYSIADGQTAGPLRPPWSWRRAGTHGSPLESEGSESGGETHPQARAVTGPRLLARLQHTHARGAMFTARPHPKSDFSLTHTRRRACGECEGTVSPRHSTASVFFFFVSLSLLFSSWEPQGDAGVGILKCGLRSRRVCLQGCRWARSPGRRQGAAAEQKKCVV